MVQRSVRGLDERVVYSTHVFRTLVDSLARPGTLKQLPYPAFLGIPPTYRDDDTKPMTAANLYALGAILTLLDKEVTFAIVAAGSLLATDHPVVRWLALRSGARVVELHEAAFVLCCDGDSRGILRALHVGTLLEPESSATVIYSIERLDELVGEEDDGKDALKLELRGPGIEKLCCVHLTGFARVELQLLQELRQGYPLGVDAYFIDAAGRCLGLPRTTTLRMMNA